MNTFNKKETMTPCLVQQLFRQKIGVELDQSLVDEVLFPLLRKEKHLPRELLLDIRMTQNCKENGLSAIVICPLTETSWVPKKISSFSPIPSCLMTTDAVKRSMEGKTTSRYRRLTLGWSQYGAIEIINELRDIKHLQTGYHTRNSDDDFEEVSKFENAFIRLEDHPFTSWMESKVGTEFINGFMEDALDSDKRVSWGGHPEYMFDPILSTHY